MASPLTDLTLPQLRYFVRAAELGSMTRAADSLFVAQSAVSTAIANLERTIGARLLVRHRAKGISLTVEGERFFRHARTVLAELEDAIDGLRPDSLAGSVTVGCLPTLIPFWMPPACDELRTRHPELRALVREVAADGVGDVLRRGELELVLAYDYAVDETLSFEPVAAAPVAATVSERHPLADAGRVPLRELARDPFVLLDLPGTDAYFLGLLRDAGVAPDVAHRFASFEAVRAMVARGHGFTLLNQAPAHDATYSGLGVRRLELVDEIAPLRIGIARLASRAPTRKAAAVADELHRVAAATSAPLRIVGRLDEHGSRSAASVEHAA